MRKVYLGFLLVTATVVSCKTNSLEEDHYRIKGTVIGLETGELKVNRDSVSTAIVDGEFELNGKVEQVDTWNFSIDDTHYFSLMMDNEAMEVVIDLATADERGYISDVEIKGSAINDELNSVRTMTQSTPESKKLQELFELSKSLEPGSEAYTENYEALSDAREASRKVQSTMIKDYALNNPDSYVAAFYMRFQANEVDQTFEEFEEIVEGFSEKVKLSAFYKPLKDELEALKRMALGNIAPDFTLQTDGDEPFTLSSLRGEKIVLVDFWASWCVPCRKSYPHLKEVYEKYRNNGFEIVGVTNDSNHDSWKKAIAEDGLEWIQVADEFPPRDAGPPHTARVITEYAVPYLPSTYLLDPDGRILAKNLHAEELDNKLVEIFGF
jgi:peroxiredoxin